MKDKQYYNDLFIELKQKVKAAGLLKHTPFYGAWNIWIAFMLYFLGIMFLDKMNIFGAIIYFYILFVELWYISHDLIHGQYFKNNKYNNFFSYISGNTFIWLSNSWWRNKHNGGHHTYTNSDIHDSDIRDYDEIFTKNQWQFSFYEKHKKILFWLSLSILYINLLVLSFHYIFKNKKYIEIILNIAHIIFFTSLFLFSFWFFWGILAILWIYVFVWIHLWFAFIVNHIGMEIIDGTLVSRYSWLDLQTRTSRNIQGGYMVNHLLWWLNKQIEHHLFPTVSRKNILKLSKIVQDFCKQHDIAYHDVGFVQALSEIKHTLHTWETR